MATAAERETPRGSAGAGGGGGWLGPVATLLWALVGFSACWSLTDLEPNLLEEGLLLHVAQRLVHGEHLYRDIVYFTGPLPFELLALLFRIFGEEITVGRTVMALFLGGATAATWTFARRSGAGPLAFPAAAVIASTPALLFPMFSMFYYTPLAFCFGVLAVDAASRGVESLRWAFAAGLLVAAVALCKQTLGVVLAATLLPALAIALPRTDRLRRVAAMAAGGASLAVLTVAYYGAKGDLDDLWRCLVTIPLGLSENFSSPYLNLWPPGELAAEILPNKVVYFSSLYLLRYSLFTPQRPGYVLLFQVLYALPLLALLATGIVAALRRLPVGGWLNATFLLAMTSNLFPRSDWGHLVLALPPALIQLILLSGRLPGFGTGRNLVATGLAGALSIALASSAVGIDRWVHSEAGDPTWGPRVPLRPVSAVYRTITLPRVIRFLRGRLEPGEPIFVARAEPLLYFATDSTNPTPYTGVLTVINDEQQDRILEALPSVRFVVMSDTDQPLWTYYSEELPRIQRHLERYYRVARGYPRDDASWIVILERG
ncbi:MAG: glycosyltransferase family 39 protein, partial [Myxococcales bacterium]|nr:glycosyltransferase family 39 protein [Myxococcales bacterium]